MVVSAINSLGDVRSGDEDEDQPPNKVLARGAFSVRTQFTV
jgi:hypothetical protein